MYFTDRIVFSGGILMVVCLTTMGVVLSICEYLKIVNEEDK